MLATFILHSTDCFGLDYSCKAADGT